VTRKILISAGHNDGKDRGASGNGYVEATEAVKLRNATAEALRKLSGSPFSSARGMRAAATSVPGAPQPFSSGLGLAAGAVAAGGVVDAFARSQPAFSLAGSAGAAVGLAATRFAAFGAPPATQIEVLTDGAGDVNQVLKEAIALAKTANVAIEYHFNAGPSSATGIEVLSLAGKKALAQRVAGAIRQATGLKLRGSDSGWKSDSSGQHPRLGFCRAGGLVVEVCFISNPADMAAYVCSFQAIVNNVARVLFNER
jgi:N-acetylmuramoyl-L-alanine amidase